MINKKIELAVGQVGYVILSLIIFFCIQTVNAATIPLNQINWKVDTKTSVHVELVRSVFLSSGSFSLANTKSPNGFWELNILNLVETLTSNRFGEDRIKINATIQHIVDPDHDDSSTGGLFGSTQNDLEIRAKIRTKALFPKINPGKVVHPNQGHFDVYQMSLEGFTPVDTQDGKHFLGGYKFDVIGNHVPEPSVLFLFFIGLLGLTLNNYKNIKT